MVKVINEDSANDFVEKVNVLIKDGYKLSSSSCGYIGEVGHWTYDCEYFMAIMVKEEYIIQNENFLKEDEINENEKGESLNGDNT